MNLLRISSRLLLALIVVACAFVLARPLAAQAAAGEYYVWACGDSVYSPPVAGTQDYRAINRVLAHHGEGQTSGPTEPFDYSSAIHGGDFCPSDVYTSMGDVGASGVFTTALSTLSCMQVTDYPIRPTPQCFPIAAGRVAGYRFTAPPGTTIPSFQARLSARSSVQSPYTSNLNANDAYIPGVDTYQFRPEVVDQDGTAGVGLDAEQQVLIGNESTAIPVPNCSGDRSTNRFSCKWDVNGLSNYQASSMFGKAAVTGLDFRLRCDPNHTVAGLGNRCPVYNGQAGTNGYAARINVRAFRAKIDDPVDPTLTVGGDLASSVPAYRVGGHYLTASVSDNASPSRVILKVTRDATGENMTGDRETDADCGNNLVQTQNGTEANTWLVSQPCQPITGATIAGVDTSGWPDGSYTARARAYDIAGNLVTWGRAFTVDNSPPGTSPTATIPGTCGADAPSISTPNGPNASYPQWLRGTVSVTAKACDPGSGIAQAKIQSSLDGSSWNDLCTDDTLLAPGQTNTMSCPFNTVTYSTGGYAQGQKVYFRLWLKDRAQPSGNVGTTDATPVRYLDNTAPTVQPVAFSAPHVLGDWNHKDGSGPGAGWTNASKVTADWPQVSAGSGSPIESVKYTYRPGPSCSPVAQTLAPTATSTVLLAIDTRSADCKGANNTEGEQGRHTITVWARDVVGNENSAIPYNSIGSYDYDNRAPALSGAKKLLVSPDMFTRVNRFQLTVKSMPLVTGATEAPNARLEYTIDGGTVHKLTGCASGSFSSGSDCIIGSTSGLYDSEPDTDPRAPLKAPPFGGAHTVTAWVRDAAGNASRESSASASLKLNDDICVR